MKVTSSLNSGQGIPIVNYRKPIVIQCNDRLSWVGRKTKHRTRLELLPLYILYRVFVRTFSMGVEREGDDDVLRRTSTESLE